MRRTPMRRMLSAFVLTLALGLPLALGSIVLATSLTYSGDGADGFVAGESVTASNFNEIKTAVDDNDLRIDAVLTTDTCTSPPCALTASNVTGSDVNFVTGTAGSAGRCAEWDGNGDLVTAGFDCGRATALDLGDTGTNDANDLAEIATLNDTNSVFTNPSANKLLIDVGQPWPDAQGIDSDNDGTREVSVVGGDEGSVFLLDGTWGFGGSSMIAPTDSIGDGPVVDTITTQADNATFSAVDADWVDTDPANVGDALDRIAARDGHFYAVDYASGSSTGGIQEAIDAAETAGGGEVRAPAGTTTIDLGRINGPNSLSITVDDTAKTFTRGSGSFVTDGVAVDMMIAFCSGTCADGEFDPFSNAGNNLSYRVTNVTALAVTVADPADSLTTEGPVASLTYEAGKIGVEVPQNVTLTGYTGLKQDHLGSGASATPGTLLEFQNVGAGVGVYTNGIAASVRDLAIEVEDNLTRHKYSAAVLCGYQTYSGEVSIEHLSINGLGANSRGTGFWNRGCVSGTFSNSQVWRFGTDPNGSNIRHEGFSSSQVSNAFPYFRIHTQSGDGIIFTRATGGSCSTGFVSHSTIEGGDTGIRTTAAVSCQVRAFANHFEAGTTNVLLNGNRPFSSIGNHYGGSASKDLDRDTAQFNSEDHDLSIGDTFTNATSAEYAAGRLTLIEPLNLGGSLSGAIYRIGAEFNIGAAPPAECVPGQTFIDTDETDDTNCTTANDNSVCLCIATDTWASLENN